MRIQRAVCFSLLVAFLCFVGCDKVNTAEVRGNVRFDGKPIAAGAILFVPADGMAPTAGGKITNGVYSVKVPPGLMKVSISVPKVVGKKKLYPTPDSPEQDVTAEAAPARYNEKTDLTFDVQPGKNEKDFELKSK